ncbi:hypothetical protein FHS83_003417 [Rhizomicrobium palustre]|uniref:Tail specific protease domain-containing protein n=1 Tax=Rhizomicrobium palustre TaxID=189966 RepID=A0A846N3L0_9PROT|nr:S41 family peptidase [Rhizomicrobium palustre]NIK90099.1 hypothetical protein [Rhizomicrobium palustre]
MFGSAAGRFAGVALACLMTASAAAATPDESEMEFPDGWFAATEAPPATLTPEEATAQVNAIFDLVDRHIFDPEKTAEARAKAREAALAAVKQGPQDQKTVGDSIEKALVGMGYSHMHLFPPAIARKLADMTDGKDDGEPAQAVITAHMEGDVGILRVSSFMVPLFNQKDLAKAQAKLRKAKTLVIDLTGNGGGNVSPVVALAHPLVGAGKPIVKDVKRPAGTPTPIDQFGPLPDNTNHGGGADDRLSEIHGVVTWFTAKTPVPANHRPTYLVIDGHCASSCEIFSGAIKHYGAARLLGRNTAGKVLGGIAFRPPMKGYALLVATSTTYGPGGEFYEGPGVAPDVELTQCQTAKDKTADSGACLTAALDYIKAQPH